MDNSYFGETNPGNERSGSSRKSKKSNSDKPKQPQRGLGVAQLEKIRLHSQMISGYLPSLSTPYPTNFNQEEVRLPTGYPSVPSSSSFTYSSPSSLSPSHGFHPNTMMGFGELERANMGYGDSQPNAITRWNNSSCMVETYQFAQPSMTRELLNPHVEDPLEKKRNKNRSNGSGSKNPESSDPQEVDLELKLSL